MSPVPTRKDTNPQKALRVCLVARFISESLSLLRQADFNMLSGDFGMCSLVEKGSIVPVSNGL
jgi:hypothetical protein